MGVPHRERGRRMDEMLEAVTALWAGDDVTYRGKYYRFEHLTIDPKPVQKPHPPIWIGGGTQPSEKIYAQTVTNIDPVLRRIAKYARTWVPHSSATADMVRGDWEKIQRFMVEFGRKPDEMSKVYSNFVYVLKKGERPESAVPHFKVYSGMDLPYWREFYLLGEAEELAEKIRAKIDEPRRLRAHRAEPARLGDGAARAAGRRGAAAGGQALSEDLARASAARSAGARVKRVEDPRLLTGRGRYLDDIVLPGLAPRGLRPERARARALSARRRGGGAPRARRRRRAHRAATSPAVVAPLAPRLDAPGFAPTAWPALADSRVRFVGEPVAVVVADTAYAAADARRARERRTTSRCRRRRPGRGARRARLASTTSTTGNVLFERRDRHGDVERRVRRARRSCSARRFSHGRCSASPLEPRGIDRALGGRGPHRLDGHAGAAHLSAPRSPAPSGSRRATCA